ncbi:MAG: HisA/HisF-related TIM barrel protein [Candidatus Natronoplasma sp.]
MDKEIIPSISITDERPVVVEKDRYIPFTRNGKELDLWGVLEELTDHDKVYILDIDGIEFDRPQTDVIRKVSTRKEVWADTGARDSAGITDSFIAGADKSIISTKTMRSKESMEKSIELSDELILSIDYKDGLISPSEEIRNMGVRRIGEFVLDQGVDTIIFTDLSNQDFEERTLRSLPEGDYRLFVGGVKRERADYLQHHNLKGFILTLREVIR